MNWRHYFSNTVLERARKYYKRGLVQNVEKVNEKYNAEVIGTVPYQVSVWKKANLQLGMTCTCPYAQDSKKCKHMAALCMKLDDVLNGKESVPISAQKPKKLDKQVYPFKLKNVPGSKEYICFDLAVITQDIKIMDSQLEAARELLEKGDVSLNSVSSGYVQSYYEDMLPTCRAVATYKDSRGKVPIIMRFTSKRILETRCQATGCNNYYTTSYYYSVPKLCKHELAVLLLLEEYIDKYNPGDTTDLDALHMLKQYERKYRSQVFHSVETVQKDLQIEPRLELSSAGVEISFRAGIQKLYVVKNLEEFINNVESNQVQSFGAKTQIDYGQHKVCPASEKYYDFIRKVVREERLRFDMMSIYESDASIIESKILLYGKRVDEIFDLMMQNELKIPYQDKLLGRKNIFLSAKEKTPEVQLMLRGNYDNNVFKGITVCGELPEIIKGEKYSYYIEEPYLYRMDPDKVNVLFPLFEMENNGRIQFEIGRKSLAEFYYHTMPLLSEYVEFIENISEDIEEYLPPQAVFQFYLDEEDGKFVCEAKVIYGEEELSLLDHNEETKAFHLRDVNAEREVQYHVMRYFPIVNEEKEVFVCESEELACTILETGINELMAIGEVLCTERMKRIHFRKKTAMSVGVSLESGIMELEVSSEELSNKELLGLLESYRKKKKYHRLSNGDFINTEDENIAMLAAMIDTLQVPTKEFLKGKIQVPAYRALYLDKVLEKNETLYVERDRHFRALIKEFKTMEDSDFESPKSLQKVMRPYQITGFKWLKTLEAYGFGGILADDMGLGKTLQVISVLLLAKEEKKKGTSLIVSPASLIYNWQEEFHKFAPKMKILVINGTQTERKELLAGYDKYDVVITSYDLLKRDIGEYENKHFLYQIIDEAQYIKNHTTIVAKAVKCIQSTTKYALTGTPIENRLSELWSIFDYLMPGFLYGYETFRKELELPVAKNKDEEASKRLKRMVAPFILRRLKQDVLKDLPDKLEKIQYARFEEKQQNVYDAQVVRMKEMLATQSGEEFSQNKIQILAELTKLREICCDPSLLFENYDGDSAKSDMCVDLVKRAIEGEHRILIFSQFTSMLSLLEKELTNEGIAFYKITGATKKEERIRLVKQFNEGDVPVFFISLKAGGTGLNLVGADTVIHYDPWWNQAVQNQATDRAHRIGQKKVVTVYKLIMKDTIEEKIVKLQESKKNLADEILSGENGGLAQLSREELLALL